MLKHHLSLAAFALVAMLTVPADVDAALMDAGGYADVQAQSEHRLHHCGSPVDGVPLRPKRADPATGL